MITTFIRLTEANEKKCKLLLNVANISVIQSGNSANTYIRMITPAFDRDSRNKTDYYFVMETLEQIERMINPPNYGGSATGRGAT